MSDFASAIAQQGDMSIEEQKKIGQPIGDDMGDEHKNFLATIIRMLDQKEIDVRVPTSFLKHEHYDPLLEESKAKVDLVMINLADELRKIEEFFRSKETPNASPQLQTMIEFLWQAKNRVEKEHGDVFKF